jgi:hypothetical protein
LQPETSHPYGALQLLRDDTLCFARIEMNRWDEIERYAVYRREQVLAHAAHLRLLRAAGDGRRHGRLKAIISRLRPPRLTSRPSAALTNRAPDACG